MFDSYVLTYYKTGEKNIQLRIKIMRLTKRARCCMVPYAHDYLIVESSIYATRNLKFTINILCPLFSYW